MTPEQKELEDGHLAAYAAWRADKTIDLEFRTLNDHWAMELTDKPTWDNPLFFYRLAPPAEIPWHNPEGVTQEQLEPEKGWRFLTVNEIGQHNKRRFCSYWMGDKLRSEWSKDNDSVGAFSTWTYRTRERPPAKYQHLVPESEEARAKGELPSVSVMGFGPFEWVGRGPFPFPKQDEYLIAWNRLDHRWETDRHDGLSGNLFYARARKLPTDQERNAAKDREYYDRVAGFDQEKAEAALNAYKLEPGERLVMRGERWRTKANASFLRYDYHNRKIVRFDGNIANGLSGSYYAEIIKEPEVVPWDINSCPVDGYFRDNRFADSYRKMVMVCRVKRGVILAANEISVEPTYFVTWRELFEHYEFSEAIGTTWTRAGKGVGS